MPPAPSLADRFRLNESGQLSMQDPLTGEFRWIPPAEVPGALKDGYVPETVESFGARETHRAEVEQYTNPGRAAFLGAARGLTFGLSDLAFTKLGTASPEEIRKIEEYNPVASLGGDIAGTVGSFALPFGVGGQVGRGAAKVGGLAAKGTRTALRTGREVGAGASALVRESAAALRPSNWFARSGTGLVPKPFMTRVAERAGEIGVTRPAEKIVGELVETGVKEGITGAVVGTGQAISDVVLDPNDLTGGQILDRLAAGAKTGALVFGGLGVAAKGLGAASKGIEKRWGRGLREMKAVKAELGVARAEFKSIEALGAGPERLAAARSTINTLETALAKAESNVAIQMFGRTAGLGLAYAMDGGIGMSALGFAMGPKAARYLAGITKPMTGPLGGVVKDVQVGLGPEALRVAKNAPLDKMYKGWLAGGPVGAGLAVGKFQVEKAMGRVFGSNAIAEKIWPTLTGRGGLDAVMGVQGAAATGKKVQRLFADLDPNAVIPALDVDLDRVDTMLRLQTANVAEPVAAKATGRLMDVVRYLYEQNPGKGGKDPATIPQQAKHNFMQQVKVIAAPASLFKAMGNLAVTPIQVQAFMAAYPEAYKQFSKILTSQIDATKALGGKYSLDQQRVHRTFLGATAKAEMYDARRVQTFQNMYREQKEPGPAPRPRQVGGLSASAATPAQRLEGTK